MKNAWGRQPLYVRAVLAGLAVFWLGQFGFALVNVRSTAVVALGVACLLTAPYVAYRALQSLRKELSK